MANYPSSYGTGQTLCWSWQPGGYDNCSIKLGTDSFWLEIARSITNPFYQQRTTPDLWSFNYSQASTPDGYWFTTQGSVSIQVVPAPILGADLPGFFLAALILLAVAARTVIAKAEDRNG
jgi:hypothetical protein